MPANLTPQFLSARNKYHAASTLQERIDALSEMYRTIPKHKGTDKMQASIKKQLASLRIKDQQQKHQGKQKPFWAIDKQGCGRLVLIGPPNSGKSSIMKATTNAHTDIASYPFTTQKPIPGMIFYNKVQFQLIDLPPYITGKPSWLNDISRTADLLLLTLDLSSDDIIFELEDLWQEIQSSHLHTISPHATLTRLHDEVIDENRLFNDTNTRKAIILANKCDCANAKQRLTLLEECCSMLEINLPIHLVSSQQQESIEVLLEAIYQYLKIVKVYTKIPGKKPDFNNPVVVYEGTTLIELASSIHNDFSSKLKYARVWGRKTFDGQRVSGDYQLHEDDIVELHIK